MARKKMEETVSFVRDPKGGGWFYRVRHPLTGEWTSRRRAKTQAEAAVKAVSWQEELKDAGMLVEVTSPAGRKPTGKVTVGMCFEKWAKEAERDVALGLRRNFPDVISAFERHVLPKWKDEAIADLDLAAYRDWVWDTFSVCARTGKQKRGKSINDPAVKGMNRLLAIARDEHGISRPLVKRFGDVTRGSEKKALTLEETRDLLKRLRLHAKTDDGVYLGYYEMVLVLATTGMRVREYRALKWSDVDFEQGRLRKVEYKGGRHPVETWLDVPLNVMRELKALRKRIEAIEAWPDLIANDATRDRLLRYGGQVLPERSIDGEGRADWKGPMNSKVDWRWRKLRGIIGVPTDDKRYTLSTIGRHGVVSILREMGVPAWKVARITGHSVEILERHYNHAEADLRATMQLTGGGALDLDELDEG